MKRGFTLVELMMVIAIVAILAAMSLAALASAAEEGKRQRARTQIARIDQLIMEKWNSYRYRQLPIRIPSGENPATARMGRLTAMRELQRMEMPDRLTDVIDGPAAYSPANNPYPIVRPALSSAYVRHFANTTAATTGSYDQAECLYAIIAQMRDGERSALDFFLTSEIGDVDGDGAYEILDPWGTPIMWLRWAPGYSKYTAADTPTPYTAPVAPAPLAQVALDTMQIQDGRLKPDPFDPLKADPRHASPSQGFSPFELRPLIVSAGPDRAFDLFFDDGSAVSTLHYQTWYSDPYHFMVLGGGNAWLGAPADYDNDGLHYGDNITNHGLAVEMGTVQ